MHRTTNLRPPKTRVVIVDDSKTMQAALEQIFSLRLGFEVVGLASSAETAVPLIQSLRPDLVTIDLCMPYIDGGRLLEMLADLPTTRKIIVSGEACGNLAMIARLEGAGADACLDKRELSRDPAAFCAKVRAVMVAPTAARPALVSRPERAPLIVAQPETSRANGFPVPLDERERLAALARAGLANDNEDTRLDLLTAHLKATTDFPTCLVTFIDRTTQWIKSAAGFERGAMPRALAFCNYTLCASDPFIVSNAATDPRFAGHPLVTGEPCIRTYVGAPIVSAEGVRLGAVCLIDTKPRCVTPGVVTNLVSISRIAAALIGDRSDQMAAAA